MAGRQPQAACGQLPVCRCCTTGSRYRSRAGLLVANYMFPWVPWTTPHYGETRWRSASDPWNRKLAAAGRTASGRGASVPEKSHLFHNHCYYDGSNKIVVMIVTLLTHIGACLWVMNYKI